MVPTNPLILSKYDVQVASCDLAEIVPFVERNHYSHSVKGVNATDCFRVTHDSGLIGAAIFGLPAYKQQIRRYSENGKFNLVELRRFVLIDDTPNNTESYSLSRMFRYLRKKGIQRILSYSDPQHGHDGTIYRALGFEYVGQTPATQVILWNGTHYSHRSANRCDNYTRTLGQAGKKLRAAIASGAAQLVMEPGKFIYVKTFLLILLMVAGAAYAAWKRCAARVTKWWKA